jgi:adenine deaminase
VLQCKAEVMDKIHLSGNKPVDGHGPGLRGKALTGYIAAGVNSDHECTTADEAAERLAQGMYIMLREGSAAKNLLDLLPVVNPYTARRCLFVTDDRHPADLSELGHINHMVKMAIDAGIDMALAIQMATINAAQYFRLYELGAIAPGYRADILALRDLENWQPSMVFKDGKLAARDGRPLFEGCSTAAVGIRNTVHVGEVDPAKLRIPAQSSQALVIELMPHQITTRKRVMTVSVESGEFVASPEADILKVAVFERHRGSGNVGVGLLHGFGLYEGAIASTIAHDSHNLVVAGMNDADMLLAAEEVKRMQGGLAITSRGRVLGTLALPLAGLMADDDILTVQTQLKKMLDIAYKQGVRPEYDPFLTLAFLCLPVIPELRITDQGLVDVNSCSIVPLSS